MNCRKFQHLLPDWMSERLPAQQASRMEAHHASCAECRRAAAAEREMRRRWQELPQAPDLHSLWPRLAQRIETTPPLRRSPLFPALAMGSALAVAGLGLFFMRPQGPDRTPGVQPHVEESRIVQMVSENQQSPVSETDAFFAETQQDRQAMRSVLRNRGEN